MATCPNKNLPEWQNLVKEVGSFKAMKYYLIHNDIGDVEVVKDYFSQQEQENIYTEQDAQVNLDDKVKQLKTEAESRGEDSRFYSDSIIDVLRAGSEPLVLNAQVQSEIRGLATIRQFAEKLSEQVGIEVEFITRDEAVALTKNATDSLTYEQIEQENIMRGKVAPPGFYYGGRIYFVGDSITSENVIHEFAHPIIRAVLKSTTDKKIGMRWYSQLVEARPDLIQALKENRPDLKVGSDMFIEEALVMAFTEAGLKMQNNEPLESGFKKLINNILYVLKQLLKKLFGSEVKVGNLKPNTTLDQLAKALMTGKNFVLDLNQISQEDIVAYMTDQKNINDLVEDAKKIPGSIIHDHIDAVQNVVNNLKRMATNENYDELFKALDDPEYKNTNAFRDLESSARKVKSILQAKAENRIKEIEGDIETAKAFADTIHSLDLIMERIEDHVNTIIESETNDIDSMQRFHYYQQFLRYWNKYIEDLNETFIDSRTLGFRLDSNSPLLRTLSSIQIKINRINKQMDSVKEKGAVEGIYDQFSITAETLSKRYEEIINNLTKAQAPPEQIERWHIEYHGMTRAELKEFNTLSAKRKKSGGKLIGSSEIKYRELLIKHNDGVSITREKIEGLLKGNLGDASWFGSFFEGYLYNNDAIVGGLALYIKQGINESLVNAQSKYTEFAETMAPLLKKIGYNPANLGELGELFGFLDKVGVIKDGKYSEKLIWTFLNKFKDYRAVETKLEHELSEAAKAFAEKHNTETQLAYLDAKIKLDNWRTDYMHQEMVPQYYLDKQSIGEDTIGKRARLERDEALRKLSDAEYKLDRAETEDEIEEALTEKRIYQLEYSQLFSSVYLDGTAKKGDDLAISERLSLYREKMSKYYVSEPNFKAFEKAYLIYSRDVDSRNISEENKEALKQAWKDRNTRKLIKQDFYDRRRELMKKEEELLAKIKDSDVRKKLIVSKKRRTINNIISGVTENGETRADELPEGVMARILQLEKEIQEANDLFENSSGLNKQERDDLSNIYDIPYKERTEEQKSRFKFLTEKRDKLGLNEYEKKALMGIREELRALSKNIASEQYLAHFNYYLNKSAHNEKSKAIDVIKNMTGQNQLDQITANEILIQDYVEPMLENNPEFKSWFMSNHVEYETKRKNSDTGKFETVKRYRRIAPWNVLVPNDPAYYETISNYYKSDVLGELNGMPTHRFYSRKKNNIFKTGWNEKTGMVEKVVGVHVNNKNEWLPRTLDEGAKNSDFINDKYSEMIKDPNKKEVLERLTEFHLKYQEGSPHRTKLYLDFPRFGNQNLEYLRKEGGLKGLGKRIGKFFGKYADDFEQGLNKEEEWELIKTDYFDDDIKRIPVRGLYNLEWQDTSTDITRSMMRYMLSLEQHKQLVRMSPLTRTVQDIVEKNDLESTTQILKDSYLNRGVVAWKKLTGKNVRRDAINSLIEREFEGKLLTGWLSDSAGAQKFANGLFKLSSYQFFALNIPSALKNSFGAKFQSMIEAAAGKYYSPVDWQKGNLFAYKAMAELSFGGQLYTRGAKSLTQQFVDIWDPAQGRTEDKFGETMSRTLLSDAAGTSWMYNFRKWVELQATLQTFGAMMHHKKIKQFEGTAKEKEIDYIDAFELNNKKQIQLKEGIDPKYGITYDADGNVKMGKEFSYYKNKIHQVINNLQGAYAKFDQPQANRYLAYRFWAFLRKYLTPMVANRFAFKGNPLTGTARGRLNPGLGDVHMGYYVQTINWLANVIKSGGASLQFTQKEEKAAIMRTLTEFVALYVVYLAISMMFGFDSDDEDKWKKLRKKSGSLPLWGVRDEGDFDFKGWMENHTLLLLMNIKAENGQFMPLPGLGLNEYMEHLNFKSIAIGPTLDAYTDILEDLLYMATGNKQAVYARDAGPYVWQSEGSYKIWNRMARVLGITGSSVDPIRSAKNLTSIQARK